jgi:SAM-dependent methyltransferase
MTDTAATATNAAMDDSWNGQAGDTWVELGRLLDQELHPLGLEAQDTLDLQPGERVLDIGCGAGETSLDLARAVSPGGAVLGVDISRALLQQVAEPRVAGQGLDIRFQVADAQTCDFAGERFDAVFSRFGVMFFCDATAAFANILKALKPGGRLAFVCWRDALENPHITAPLKAVEHLLPPLPPSDPLAPGPFAFADPERVRRILGEAGFGEIAIRSYDVQVCGWSLEDRMVIAERVGPLAAVLRENPDLRPQVLDVVAADLRRQMGADGKVRTDAAVWIVTATAPAAHLERVSLDDTVRQAQPDPLHPQH